MTPCPVCTVPLAEGCHAECVRVIEGYQENERLVRHLWSTR